MPDREATGNRTWYGGRHAQACGRLLNTPGSLKVSPYALKTAFPTGGPIFPTKDDQAGKARAPQEVLR